MRTKFNWFNWFKWLKIILGAVLIGVSTVIVLAFLMLLSIFVTPA